MGDLFVLTLALAAAYCWFLAENPTTAMVLLAGADVLGIVPSIHKAWKRPREETHSMWSLSALRQGLSIAALSDYGLVSSLNPLVWLILNALMSALLLIRRRA